MDTLLNLKIFTTDFMVFQIFGTCTPLYKKLSAALHFDLVYQFLKKLKQVCINFSIIDLLYFVFTHKFIYLIVIFC